MAINEFDDVTVKEGFGGNKELMHDTVKAIANDISKEIECDVYYGKETGLAGCDEICVFIPYNYEREKIKQTFEYVDKNAYNFERSMVHD